MDTITELIKSTVGYHIERGRMIMSLIQNPPGCEDMVLTLVENDIDIYYTILHDTRAVVNIFTTIYDALIKNFAKIKNLKGRDKENWLY
jgi:hypothetical protein